MMGLHWRRSGERIKTGLSVQWVGGILIHYMPRHRRHRWKIRIHLYNRQPFKVMWDVYRQRVVASEKS